MTDKLPSGAVFPAVSLTLTSGEHVDLPDGLGTGYRVILFYRGHW